jgi:hypothetical protein
MPIAREELVKRGASKRAMPLVQQTRTTMLVAAGDGEALVALLPSPTYLTDTAAKADAVEAALSDRFIAEADAKGATSVQDEAMANLKNWRRRAVKRASRARNQGAAIPAELTVLGRQDSVSTTLTAAHDQVSKLDKLSAEIAKAGPDPAPLIAEGKTLVAALSAADAEQEAARLATFPKAVLDFYAAKGELYFALKAINDAGQELHAGSPADAGKYNLSILNRRSARPTNGDADPVAPTA